MNTTVKQLDAKALEIIKRMKSEGKIYKQITFELIRFGYTTVGGSKLDNATVSQFACRNGFRTNKPHVRKMSKRKASTPHSLKPVLPGHITFNVSTETAPSCYLQLGSKRVNLTPAQKLAVLEVLV